MQSRSKLLLEFPKVLGILAELCVSEPGAERCTRIAPFDNPKDLELEAELTRQFTDWKLETGFRLPVFPSLLGFLDHLKRPSEVFDLDALWAVSQVLGDARDVRSRMQEADPERWPLLGALTEFTWPDTLWPALKRCINADGLLRDESSPELYSVRSEIRAIHQRCTKRVKSFVDQKGIAQYMQEDFMTVSSDRYVLPLKTNFKNKLPGIIHDYSQTGETCYFEPMFLVDQNNELQELKKEERSAEKEILRYLSGLMRQEEDALRACYEFLINADILFAKARFAKRFDARPVDITEGAPLNLRNARHPLLVQSNEANVPVDLILEEGQKALIVSGGNAGGKTVCLKTLGLSALMGLSGLPVCVAEGSSMPLWRKVFVLLGDEQSIEDSLSTFTAQIKNLSDAYDSVDDSTLVIMDEFGAGTDPSQGAALAQAVVDGFLAKSSWIALATHFPALKAYALTRDEVRAASVLFDPATRKPLYKLAYDQVGASQALDVAREHGLAEDILIRAEKYMLLDGSDTSKVVERLNTLAVERERELTVLRSERDKLHEKRVRYHERFEREKAKLLDDIQTQAQSVLKKWREDKIGRKQALKELAELRKQAAVEQGGASVEDEAQAKPLGWDDLAVGMAMKHQGLGKKGVIAGLNERRQQVKLDMGGVSVWADIASLTPDHVENGPVDVTVNVPAGGAAQTMVLDLRGMRADEAEAQLYKFLDGAVLSGREELEVVHGRGTGALRKEVHRILKGFPAVARFSLAPEDRGGDGMTIVELK
ncbi:endonuclease MutS2 [Desulfovibrio ferrophilus]|uniref:Endonuclease MutS2 n=1 Tax=Desulfovibrio ferrophilus TaxID=241368 RepID=A0A2Z6AX53_9BACT|nr:Smr/MutS family protein [Desulfovibrio ferrophilus]BBD07785.1 endonuclease MutS2 [Desulfovibrio ferrophilus]